MSPNSVIRQICHQIHWIFKYVTKFSELANLSSNTVNHQMCHQLPNWSNIWFQGLAVMLGCRLPTPVGPPSTSHTAVDLKSYTTRLWKSWKQERHEWSISVEGIGKCVESSGNVKHQKGIRPSLTHELWCDHVLDIKHSTSFCRYAMHVSESLKPKCGNMVESFAEGRFTWFFAT